MDPTELGTEQPPTTTTVTPGPDDGSAGGGAPAGGAPTQDPGPRMHRVSVGGRDVELSHEELLEHATRALAHDPAAEQAARARILELEEELRTTRESDLSLSTLTPPAAAGHARSIPGFDGGDRGSAYAADDDIDVSGLDPTDPRDAVVLRLHARSRQSAQTAAAEAIAMRLREQIAYMSGHPAQYPDFDPAACQSLIAREVAKGKRLDFFDAYYINRGRSAPAAAKKSADDARDGARRDAEREAASSRTTLGTVAAGGAARPTGQGRGNIIPRERVVGMTLAEYRQRTRSEGYVPDAQGNLVKQG